MFYKKYIHQERPFVLHVCIGHDSKFIEDKLNRNKKLITKIPSGYFTLDNSVVMQTYNLEDHLHGNYVIVLRDMNFDYGTIAHEAFHCVAGHFEYIGNKLNEESEESYAYMIGWIVNLFEKIKKKYDSGK